MGNYEIDIIKNDGVKTVVFAIQSVHGAVVLTAYEALRLAGEV